MHTTQVRELKAFGRVVQSRSRDLVLLKTIEETLAQLDEELVQLKMANTAADEFIVALKNHDIGSILDEDVDVVGVFEQARDHIGTYFEKISRCHISAVNDSELHDEDGVVEAFASIQEEAAELHNKLNTLAWLIGEGIADTQKPLEGEFTSAADLFATME